MKGNGETLVLGSSRSLDCGGLIHNTSCPAPPSQQMALWWWRWSPLGRWEAVPSHCLLLGGIESALPPSPNLHCICDSCEKRTCKLESERTIWGEERHETPGNFLWVLPVAFSPQKGASPPPLYTWQALGHPQSRFSTSTSALHGSNNILYANFIITPQWWEMCVYIQWRGIYAFT